MTIKKLRKCVENNTPLVWNDPDPIPGNDYNISYIEPIGDDFDSDTPIMIQYNGGISEAEVYASEISKR